MTANVERSKNLTAGLLEHQYDRLLKVALSVLDASVVHHSPANVSTRS